MRIGILKTGIFHPTIIERHNDLGPVFADLLKMGDPGIDTFVIDLAEGAPLPATGDADGWIITGSKYGVYDDLPWIDPLKEFLRASVADRVPLVGICFGHQILAEALGGRAEKFDGGWQLGVKDYVPGTVPEWMEPLSRPWSGIAVHQDQVTQLPPGATVTASAEQCAYAALIYGDMDAPDAISVQSHPEFPPDLVDSLVEVRMASVVPPEVLADYEANRHRANTSLPWAEAIIAFYRRAHSRRQLGQTG